MKGKMFIDNSNDGACSSYYTGNLQFDNFWGALLLLFPDKTVEVLVYIGFYEFALQMATDAVMKNIATLRNAENDWEWLVVSNGFVSSVISAANNSDWRRNPLRLRSVLLALAVIL